MVGVAGKSFAVTLDGCEGGDTVCGLKKAIKKTNPDKIKCSAYALDLFLAVKDGAWLELDSHNVGKLQTIAAIEKLTQDEDLELDERDSLYSVLKTAPKTSTDQIHVRILFRVKSSSISWKVR